MEDKKILKLSEPLSKGNMSLEEVFKLRTTVRGFSSKEIDFPIISQLLWALQGSLHIEIYQAENKFNTESLLQQEKVIL
ncbi:MAG: hypothetical protein ACFFCZ_04765 [Promethearchaeota archaeon]